MKKATRGPSKASLKEIPEVDFSKMRRLPRGRFAHLSAGRDVHHVTIDPDLWPHFRSAAAVNAALRAVVDMAETVKSASKVRRRARSAA